MSDTTGGGRLRRAAWTALAGLALVACGNAGEDRVLAILGTGLVGGVVYLDLDGDRTPGSADVALPDVRVQLLVSGTRDTVATAFSGADGVFAFGLVPVGQYTVVVPGEVSFGDSLSVVRVDTTIVDLVPQDTVEIQVTVSFPKVSIAETRVLPLGTKAFIEGVALNFRDVFADTVLHVRDTSRAIRITNTLGPLVTSGDSIRVLGRVAARDGQPVLDRGQVTILQIVGQPLPEQITSGQAAAADAGRLDAALVRVINATVTDTLTDLDSNYVATVDDSLPGSGPVVVVFDKEAMDAGLNATTFVPGALIDITGLLVPNGAGAWRIKPRVTGDLQALLLVRRGQ